MAYVNNYTPPSKPELVLPDPTKPYDVNFCFPVKELESDRIKLTPMIPHVHAAALFEAISTYPETMHYMPTSMPASLVEFEYYLEEFRLDPGKIMYVILDKAKIGDGFTKGGFVTIPTTRTDLTLVVDALLGTLSYCNSSTALSTVEPGFIIILPPYQRTHVNTHAVGLLMQYALDLPKDGGLGVRRVQWQAHASNQPSVRAAERLGFKMEGIIRWQRPLPAEKESSAPYRKDDSLGVPGRHTAMLAMCWDDWEQGGRDHIRVLMERKTGA